MTKKASKLLNENVIRRWGRLANMAPLTENFLDNIQEEDEDELDMPAEDELDMPAEDELGADLDAPVGEEEASAVESIVQAVVDAISAETGVDIEVEGSATDDEMPADELDMDADAELADIEVEDELPAEDEMGMDDEEMTEAVLTRVVERLLKMKK